MARTQLFVVACALPIQQRHHREPACKTWLAGAIEKLEELELLKQAAKTQLQGKTLTGALATLWNEHQATVKQRAQSLC